ncbi:hypothetical protein B0I35DRAFT_411511 [Stachybotrys elegans]|uniref:Uncharacterized protein n=1 Tax=Stachybotrys elegans TaxID=80388 RepID=A0A8K0SLQ2_9HYPO|nr:hypothetical protein B0I35DRAFT_411511 [Stachybotrys elegans]
MVRLWSLTALVALASATTAVDSSHRLTLTKEEGLKQALEIKANQTDDEPQLGRRQSSFGRYCDNWDFSGPCVYHRFSIDNIGHYIGGDWNDRISSVEGFDADKRCIYWTEYSADSGGYCYGDGLIVNGGDRFPQLGWPYNDRISCHQCSWR